MDVHQRRVDHLGQPAIDPQHLSDGFIRDLFSGKLFCQIHLGEFQQQRITERTDGIIDHAGDVRRAIDGIRIRCLHSLNGSVRIVYTIDQLCDPWRSRICTKLLGSSTFLPFTTNDKQKWDHMDPTLLFSYSVKYSNSSVWVLSSRMVESSLFFFLYDSRYFRSLSGFSRIVLGSICKQLLSDFKILF